MYLNFSPYVDSRMHLVNEYGRIGSCGLDVRSCGAKFGEKVISYVHAIPMYTMLRPHDGLYKKRSGIP